MSQTLKNRVDSYLESTDFKLLNKLPIVICLNGKSTSKITSLLDKPFCSKFSDGMLSTTMNLCSEIDGILMAYQYNDEIILIIRNDQNIDTMPWCNNKLQKICSMTSSMATCYFNNYISKLESNIMGDLIFTAQVFPVPTISEAINIIIYKQQHSFHTSIQFACFYELLQTYNKEEIKEMLNGLSIDEKIDLLKQERNIDFNQYPHIFRRGAACYKTPKIINGIMKNKWSINTELPIFAKDQSFLNNLFRLGSDIFRKENF